MRKNCPIQDGDQKEREGTKEPCQEHFQVELRNKGMKLQERRHLKQVTQFVHKDSADLLPLDGMKRLGTSKDLVSPIHSRSAWDPDLFLHLRKTWVG